MIWSTAGVKTRGGARKGKPRTKPNLFREVVPETGSDDGVGDELADAHEALQLLNSGMASIAFLPADPEPLTMPLGDGDSSEQGGDSDAESYGKEEPAPYRVYWFFIFGLGLWLKLGSPSVCLDYCLMGFYLWGRSRGKQKGTLI